MDELSFPDVLSFDWDNGNRIKSWVKHRVSAKEQEEAFFDKNKRVFTDGRHSQAEQRALLFAKTKKGRKLVIAFTKRADKIRCISARPMNKKEVPIYEKATQIA